IAAPRWALRRAVAAPVRRLHRRRARGRGIALSSYCHEHRSHSLTWSAREDNRHEHQRSADATPATGIVWAYRFRPDGAAEPIPQDKIETVLAEIGAGWIWLHLGLADTRCRNWIAQRDPISDLAREVLAGPDRHLRLDILGHEIVGVVPDLHQEFAQPGENLVRLRFV